MIMRSDSSLYHHAPQLTCNKQTTNENRRKNSMKQLSSVGVHPHPCYDFNVDRDGYLALAGPEPLKNVNDHHDDNDDHDYYNTIIALLFRDGYLALAGPEPLTIPRPQDCTHGVLNISHPVIFVIIIVVINVIL